MIRSYLLSADDLMGIAASHPDAGVRASAGAILYSARICGPYIRAEIDADKTSGTPLLGSTERYTQEIYDIVDGVPVFEVCDWRTRRAHCLCFRCGSQDIELLLARAIVAPCAGPCYWCESARDPSCYAKGIQPAARRLAESVRRPSVVTCGPLFGGAL